MRSAPPAVVSSESTLGEIHVEIDIMAAVTDIAVVHL